MSLAHHRPCLPHHALRLYPPHTSTLAAIPQAFKRVCVDEVLRHGEENEKYLLRDDMMLRTQGLTGVKVERRQPAVAPPTIRVALEAALDDDV